MKSVGYPGYYNHGEQHRRQLLGLERMQVALALRPPAVASSVRFLRSWFTLHLLQFDRPLSTYLRR
jgi:hemerythrin